MAETGRRFTKEVELTREMLLVGSNALARFDPEFATYEEGIERILRAALQAGGYSVTETQEIA